MNRIFLAISAFTMSITVIDPKDTGLIKSFSITPYDSIYPPPDLGFKKVGYLFLDSVEKKRFDINSLETKIRLLNVLCYANAVLDSNGKVFVDSLSILKKIKNVAKRNNVKIFIGIQAKSAIWKKVSSADSLRKRFSNYVMDILRRNELDGVDIDWEFPTTKDSFSQLINVLSDSCHLNGKYYLSAAIISGIWPGYREAISDTLLKSDRIDFYNIMAYDDIDIKRNPHHLQHHSTYCHADSALKYWIKNRPMPSCKAVLGIPLFGKAVEYKKIGALIKPDTIRSRPYDTLIRRGASSFNDIFLYTPADTNDCEKLSLIYHYNGKKTVQKKVRLAQQEASGIMFWEIGNDTNDSTSLLHYVSKLPVQQRQNYTCPGH